MARRGREYDVCELVPPEAVLRDGVAVPPGRREQPVTLTIDGVPGVGHLPVITRG